MCACPQRENGYTAIANEIMEALARTRMAGEHRQVLDFIIRKTYGFNKKEDIISLSQFVLGTGLKKPNVCRALMKLGQQNIVIKKDNGKPIIYRFNKDFDKWKPLSKKIMLSKKITTVIKKDNKSLSKKIPTIVDNTKETITKEIAPSGAEWDFNIYLNTLLTDPKPHIVLIGKYFKKKGYSFPDKKTANTELGRWLKVAAHIVAFPEKTQSQAVDYVLGKFPDMWTLGTIAKYISKEEIWTS